MLDKFFPLSIRALIAKIQPDKVKLCDDDFWRVLASCISASRVQHVSDLHLKFALRPSMEVGLRQTSNLRRLR